MGFFWKNLLKDSLNDQNPRYRWSTDENLDPAKESIRPCKVFVRAFLAFIINSVSRSLLLGTAPIMVSVEGPMDFIKDVMAVFFIVNLDDFDEKVEKNDDVVITGEYELSDCDDQDVA